MTAEAVELVGWTAYAFGPVLCGILLWDTIRGRAYNSYWFFGGWLIAEILAIYYVWNTGQQIPILTCGVGCFTLLGSAAIVQYVKGTKPPERG